MEEKEGKNGMHRPEAFRARGKLYVLRLVFIDLTCFDGSRHTSNLRTLYRGRDTVWSWSTQSRWFLDKENLSWTGIYAIGGLLCD